MGPDPGALMAPRGLIILQTTKFRYNAIRNINNTTRTIRHPWRLGRSSNNTYKKRKLIMSLQDKVYTQIQARIKTICASEYSTAPKTRKGYLKRPLQYSGIVEDLVKLASAVLDMSEKDAEHTFYDLTHGEIQHTFLQAKRRN